MKQLFDEKGKVALFDFSNVVFRACAVSPEQYVWRFCQMMVNYRKRLGSHEFVFALEGKGTDERRKVYAKYKEGRFPSEELIESRKACRSILQCIECVLVKAPLGEADDAIGCYLQSKDPPSTTIISEDKDLWQLIRAGKCLVMSKRLGTVTPETVRAELGVPPSKVVLYKAVFGDNSDGIPRVPRIPKAVLLDLVTRSDGLKDLLRLGSELEGPDAKRLQGCKTQIRTNYELAKIKRNLVLKTKKCHADEKKLRKRLARFEAVLSDADLNILMKGVSR